MKEKTKASKGASVSKTGNLNEQPALVDKAQWNQKVKGLENMPAQLCQDNTPSGERPGRAKKPAEKQEISEQIGRQLRSVYNDVLAQPVPDRFLELLRALEKDPK